jgi:hypothetical protein
VYELLLGALLILTVAWLVVRIRQNKEAEKAESTPARKSTGKYHAVAIKYSENACDAAKAMTGRRFLSNAAPRLPLAECDFLECRCQFAHYKDRRASRDRRSPFATAGVSGATGSYERERRERTDRRKQEDDQYDW